MIKKNLFKTAMLGLTVLCIAACGSGKKAGSTADIVAKASKMST